jgi:redox-sensitive bicupin YhaK (pirin superfamily)
MGFAALRVINDDRVKPGAGFGTHGHRDMEILSYVLEARSSTRTAPAAAGVIRPARSSSCARARGVIFKLVELRYSPN